MKEYNDHCLITNLTWHPASILKWISINRDQNEFNSISSLYSIPISHTTLLGFEYSISLFLSRCHKDKRNWYRWRLTILVVCYFKTTTTIALKEQNRDLSYGYEWTIFHLLPFNLHVFVPVLTSWKNYDINLDKRQHTLTDKPWYSCC